MRYDHVREGTGSCNNDVSADPTATTHAQRRCRVSAGNATRGAIRGAMVRSKRLWVGDFGIERPGAAAARSVLLYLLLDI